MFFVLKSQYLALQIVKKVNLYVYFFG